MKLDEPLIQTGHPPPPGANIKNGRSFSRILRKVALLLVIFFLSFHLPNLIPGLNHREQTIREILAVLERHPTGLANVTKEELAEVIYEEAIRHDQDPKFILAVIAIESEFKTWAVSVKGAKGLMQIMPEVGEFLAQERSEEHTSELQSHLNIVCRPLLVKHSNK